MNRITLNNSYYYLSQEIYGWLKYYTPSAQWDQTFGTTIIDFDTEDQLEQFKTFIKALRNE